MEVLFTKFKTVIINNKELPEKKYIDELETKIKKRKITDFTYNIEKNEYIYSYKNKKYTIDAAKCDVNSLRKLLEFLKFENELKNKETIIKEENEKREQELKNKKELKELASKGEIKSEYVKKLYQEELENQLKLNHFPNYIFSKNYIEDYDYMLGFIGFFSCFTSLSLSFVSAFSLLGDTMPFKSALIMLISSLSVLLLDVFTSIITILTGATIKFMINLFGNIFNIKRIKSNKKMIKYKLEQLKEMKLSDNEEEIKNQNEKNKLWIDYIEESMNEMLLSVALTTKLNEAEKKKIKQELEIIMKKYRKQIPYIDSDKISVETKIQATHEMLKSLNRLKEKVTNNIDQKIKPINQEQELEEQDEKKLEGQVRTLSR